MAALNFLIVLAVSATSVYSAQFYCVGPDCKNITLYLGPRFGSKTVQLNPLAPVSSSNSTSNARKNSTVHFWGDLVRRTTAKYPQEILRSKTTTTAFPRRPFDIKVLPNRVEPKVEFGAPRPFTPRGGYKVLSTAKGPYRGRFGMGSSTPRYNRVPRVRPVLGDGSQTVDLTGDDIIVNDEDWYRPREPMKTHSSAELGDDRDFTKGVLDFTGFGYNGDDLKQALISRIQQLSSKTRLVVNDNAISYLPTLTFPVEMEYSLNQLWIDNNPLRNLSSSTCFEISRLGSLKLLSLSNTSLTRLDSLSLPLLEVLYLNENSITEIPAGFPKLRQLHLRNNRISYLVPDMLDFPHLNLLDLSGNHIDFIFDHPFMRLSRLETLYLNNNSIRDVRDIDVPHSAILFLGNNPLVCSCPLARLVDERSPAVVDKQNVNCTDDNYNSYMPVSSQGLLPCRDPWSWWWTAGRWVEHVFRWFHNMGVTWYNISNFLYWTLLLVAFCAVVKVLTTKYHKIAPYAVPYDVLDNKHANMDDKQVIVDEKQAVLDYRSEKSIKEFNDKIAIIDEKNDS